MGNPSPLGYGLIGCGGFGEFCLQAVGDVAGLRAVAVADVVRAAADRLASPFGLAAHYDPADLSARDDVQLVHVATPPSSHHELVLAAVRAGKHVLCEKPLAMNISQADEMLRAAAKAGRIVPVNFVLRYNEVTEAVRRIIDSGALGKVLSARLTNCAGDTKLGPDHWFWDKSISGGIFIEHGVHFFDLYSYWLGSAEMLAAHTERREGTGQEDRVMCLMRHDSGAVTSHYHGFDQIAPLDRTDHRLVCELGDIRVEGWIPLTVEVNAAVDDERQEKLAACCDGAEIETLADYGDEQVMGRGKEHHVTRRVRMRWTPNADMQAVYADSFRALLADQIAYIRDRSHRRRITEANGRDAVALAEAAVKLAAR